MSPELEAALRELGWTEVVKKYPSIAAEVQRLLSGGVLDEPRDAREARDRLQENTQLLHLVGELHRQLDQLPESSRTRINGHAAAFKDPRRNCEKVPDAVGQLIAALHEVGGGLTRRRTTLEHDARDAGKSGRARNKTAFKIARILAAVARAGSGRWPGQGSPNRVGPDHDLKPSGPYIRAIEAALRDLGRKGDGRHYAREFFKDPEHERLACRFLAENGLLIEKS